MQRDVPTLQPTLKVDVHAVKKEYEKLFPCHRKSKQRRQRFYKRLQFVYIILMLITNYSVLK